MSKNILKTKSYVFAILIVKLPQKLATENKELVAMLINTIKTTKSRL